MSDPTVYAHGNDEGFRFILPTESRTTDAGGLVRKDDQGHTVTIVGRGGTGKTFFALQLITQILTDAYKTYERWPEERPHAAFYFTLEATPYELYQQLMQFAWGRELMGVNSGEESGGPGPAINDDRWFHKGLFIMSVPSPAQDLSALLLQVRQTVASELRNIGRVLAIGIDPLGGIDLKPDLRTDLSALKDLSTSHRTFLFLLAEDHIFERYPSIEHYSHTVIHLQHDPETEPYRRLYVQKARGQPFRSGYHHLQIDPLSGVRVFPSVQAQSAFAHELLALPPATGAVSATTTAEIAAESLFQIAGEAYPEEIQPGSVVFLMGPPGTFKQFIATRFASATEKARLYISFKADIAAVRAAAGRDHRVDPLGEDSQPAAAGDPSASAGEGVTYFLDARNPLLTPEEVLSRVRQAVIRRDIYRRAVVWGLRRLNDMPNFAGRQAVQFLEALVTLLKSRFITSLLVDWPDFEKASTLPVVDLSQYILLTRVCRGLDDPAAIGGDPATRKELEDLWHSDGNWDHISFLRIQRTAQGFHRDKGMAFRREGRMAPSPYPIGASAFERLWLRAGIKWEQDPGLVH